MTDRSIVATPLADGRVRYTLGGPNWAERRIPDIRRPGETVQVDEDRMIDVVILGDGFTAVSQFDDALAEWLREHLALKVYDTFAGCLRIRALYTPSVEPASSTRGSFYRCLTSSDGKSLATDRLNAEGETEDYDWWRADDADGRAFREAFWAGVDAFSIATERRYPLDLDVGGSNQAIHDDTLRDRYRNLIVSMLVRTSDRVDVTPENSTGLNRHPSGLAREVPRPAPNASHRVRVAFGATEVHEFSHAFGFLSDEYIKGRDSESDRVNPATASVFTLSNLTYSRPKPETPDVYETPTVDETPWIHLSPGGWRSRTAGGPNPSPLVGWLWIGGGVRHGAWHSDYRCLMNGTHDNFRFTQVAAQDPTTQPDGTYEPQETCAITTGSVCGARSSSPSAYSRRPTSCSRTAIPATSPPRGSSGMAAGSIGSAPTTTSSSTSPDRSPTVRPATPRCSRDAMASRCGNRTCTPCRRPPPSMVPPRQWRRSRTTSCSC